MYCFSAVFSVKSVFNSIGQAEMPINRAFQGCWEYTIRPVMRFVCPLPFCVLAEKAEFSVKKCKRGFHIFYTDIQNSFSIYRSDLYICITEKALKTPINTRFFHVSQIGIYRYTDEMHIQREGKGEGKTGNRA